ncbi:MAG TPA: hypothetical protein DIU09_14130 [Hyphomonadaceae bacterium]|nr:hypothetical protein [Hyphomonadaceae bacterium]
MVEESRFVRISANGAKWVLGLLLALILASLWAAAHQPKSPTQPVSAAKSEHKAAQSGEAETDLALYKAIVGRVQAGENYYAVATDEQRKRGYPLKPFVTVRLPTLALILASLGKTWGFVLELAIGLATLFVWYQKLVEQKVVAGRRVTFVGLLAAGLSPILVREAIYLHEIWAGALIALSIGLYRPNNWLPSLLVAACALALRELALPFVLLMAAFALVQRRWVETAAWSALILLFFAGVYLHFKAVSGVVLPNDPKSQTWLLLSGPTAALSFMWQALPLVELPQLIGYPIIVVGLFGWLCWRSEASLFVLLLLLGYMLAFAITGRANNFYWGYLVSPLLMMGLIFVGPGLRDLQTALKGVGASSKR